MLLLPCGRQEKNTIKHLSLTKIHMDESEHMGSTESTKFNANLVWRTTPTPDPAQLLPVEAISILSEENLFIWSCIFLFCPLEEIPELALRRLMPQLPSRCSSSC